MSDLSRLERLEDDFKEMKSTQVQIFDLLREVREAQIRTTEREKIFACTKPNSCVTLEAQLKALAETQRAHENYIAQAQGAGKLTRVLWAVFGSVGLIAAVKSLFTK
jgi:hypothetical protein